MNAGRHSCRCCCRLLKHCRNVHYAVVMSSPFVDCFARLNSYSALVCRYVRVNLSLRLYLSPDCNALSMCPLRLTCVCASSYYEHYTATSNLRTAQMHNFFFDFIFLIIFLWIVALNWFFFIFHWNIKSYSLFLFDFNFYMSEIRHLCKWIL